MPRRLYSRPRPCEWDHPIIRAGITMQSCGIDFGTSNSTLGVSGPGISGPVGPLLVPLEGEATTLPSAVFWPDEGAPLFGRAAIAAGLGEEDGRLMRGLKSTLGSGLIHDSTRVGARAVSFRQVLMRYLAHLRSKLPQDVPAVVMGRPVHFIDQDPAGDAEAEATLAAIARDTGFREVSFQFEPVAAALHYETTVQREELVLIVDIGGGTSDISLVRVGPWRAAAADRSADILGNDGIRLGGTDLDRMLSLATALPHLGFGATTRGGSGLMPRHYFLDLATWYRINRLYTPQVRRDLKALRNDADQPELIDRLIRLLDGHRGHALAGAVEEVKIALSHAEIARLMLSPLCGAPNPLVRRVEFEAAIEGATSRLEALISGSLAMAGLRADQIGAVFLTGGSSRLPVLRDLIARLLPGIALQSGDDFGSVGTGLALEAGRRYG